MEPESIDNLFSFVTLKSDVATFLATNPDPSEVILCAKSLPELTLAFIWLLAYNSEFLISIPLSWVTLFVTVVVSYAPAPETLILYSIPLLSGVPRCAFESKLRFAAVSLALSIEIPAPEVISFL